MQFYLKMLPLFDRLDRRRLFNVVHFTINCFSLSLLGTPLAMPVLRCTLQLHFFRNYLSESDAAVREDQAKLDQMIFEANRYDSGWPFGQGSYFLSTPSCKVSRLGVYSSALLVVAKPTTLHDTDFPYNPFIIPYNLPLTLVCIHVQVCPRLSFLLGSVVHYTSQDFQDWIWIHGESFKVNNFSKKEILFTAMTIVSIRFSLDFSICRMYYYSFCRVSIPLAFSVCLLWDF